MSAIPYSRIVAGADGSDSSEHAVRHAAILAKALGAALRVVHVVDLGWLMAAPEMALDVDEVANAWRAQGADPAAWPTVWRAARPSR